MLFAESILILEKIVECMQSTKLPLLFLVINGHLNRVLLHRFTGKFRELDDKSRWHTFGAAPEKTRMQYQQCFPLRLPRPISTGKTLANVSSRSTVGLLPTMAVTDIQ